MKYFAVSDIHSFYWPLMKALETAGYDKADPDHTLIVIGDVFDRGPDAMKVYDFLTSIDPGRLILLRGNHEDCYEELLEKPAPNRADVDNGTVSTFAQVAGYKTLEKALSSWDDVLEKVKASPVTKWVKSDVWKPYFELGDYVFTHNFIPMHNPKGLGMFKQFYDGYELEYFPEWRTEATEKEWHEARWGCSWKQFKAGYFKEEGKTLVCGHWHASDFHKEFEGRENDYTIYRGESLIAIDGCTALTNRVNVLVINGDRLSDQYGRNLDDISHKETASDSYCLPAYSAWNMDDRLWCGSDCGNRLCIRNLKYNLPRDRYISQADMGGDCADFE